MATAINSIRIGEGPSPAMGARGRIAVLALGVAATVQLAAPPGSALLTLPPTIVLLLLSSATLVVSSRRKTLDSPASLSAILYPLHFAMPGLLAAIGLMTAESTLNAPFLAGALWRGTACFAGLLAGYELWMAIRGMGARERSWGLSGSIIAPRLGTALAVGLISSGWLIRAYVIQQEVYFQSVRGDIGVLSTGWTPYVRLVESFPLYASFLLAFLVAQQAAQGATTRRLSSYAIMVTVSELLYWGVAGRKEETILALILPLLARHVISGHIPSRRFRTILITFVVLLFPLMNFYRLGLEAIAIAGGVTRQDATEIVQSSQELYEGGALNQVVNRVSLVEPVAAAIRIRDAGIELPGLEQGYWTVVYSVVPRFLWPSKPNVHFGTTFGQEAGLIESNDQVTSVAMGYVGEAVLVLGLAAPIAFMVFGFVSGIVYDATALHPSTPRRFLYGIAMPGIIYIGGTAALYLGGYLKVLVLFSAAMFFASSRRQIARRAAISEGVADARSVR